MGLFDMLGGLFGGGGSPASQLPNSLSDPGAMSNAQMSALAAANAATNPATMAIPNQQGPYSTMNSTPFATPQQAGTAIGNGGGGLGSTLGQLGSLGAELGKINTGVTPPVPPPISQPGAGGGIARGSLPTTNFNTPGPLGAITAQGPAPLGPAGQNPTLLHLLQARLGMGGGQ